VGEAGLTEFMGAGVTVGDGHRAEV